MNGRGVEVEAEVSERTTSLERSGRSSEAQGRGDVQGI